MNVDPSSPEVQALMALHFIAWSAPDIRCKIQKATASPQTPMNDLFQLAYLVFSNKDMTKKAEHTQRNMQKGQMIAVSLSAQRRPKWKPSFLGQSDPGRPQGPRVPIKGQCPLCGQKGHWRKDCDPCVLCKQPGHWKRECPRCQRATGAPQPLMVLQSEDCRYPRPKVALPRDTIYITNVEPHVVIDVANQCDRISYRHWCNLLSLNTKDWKP